MSLNIVWWLILWETWTLTSTITAEESIKIVDSRVEQAVMSSPLMHIEGFLLALTNPDKDGRIVINKKSKTAQPIKHLQETKTPRHKSCW